MVSKKSNEGFLGRVTVKCLFSTVSRPLDLAAWFYADLDKSHLDKVITKKSPSGKPRGD